MRIPATGVHSDGSLIRLILILPLDCCVTGSLWGVLNCLQGIQYIDFQWAVGAPGIRPKSHGQAGDADLGAGSLEMGVEAVGMQETIQGWGRCKMRKNT